MERGIVDKLDLPTKASIHPGSFLFAYPNILNTEQAYKWKLSSSAHQSGIGILCFDWLIHPGISYSAKFEFSLNGKEVIARFLSFFG